MHTCMPNCCEADRVDRALVCPENHRRDRGRDNRDASHGYALHSTQGAAFSGSLPPVSAACSIVAAVYTTTITTIQRT